ncbi:hypothetical protein D5S18_28485 [Nocardia panacis]|uniref:DUF4436 domain-containing protein n=1 Tax=Nocardia panacis TaxID=2340916 RepID=A0A3A4K178_9NOCA|nr:hypothetical protein [Nocardia panacis]RJO69837.1 hypothetical protein D5S18_28485 [Nocardia panacis]
MKVLRIVLALLVVGLSWLPSAPARAADGVRMMVSIDDRDVGGSAANSPIPLSSETGARVTVALLNKTETPVVAHRVEMTGKVLGLTFFSYATAVELTIAPGKTETLHYVLDLTGLARQTTGLIGGEVVVYGTGGERLAGVPIVADVRGSLWSVYGLFGLALVALTVAAIADVTLSIVRNRFPDNRFRRGLRLLVPALGIGMVFGFVASVARWWVPEADMWWAVAGGCAVLGFLLGYSSPVAEAGYAVPEFAELTGDLDDELVDPSAGDREPVRLEGGRTSLPPGVISGGAQRVSPPVDTR